MSVPVRIEDLGDALQAVGSGYLLTTALDGAGRIKAVSVDPELVDGVLRTQPSRGSAANLASNPLVTLVFPPLEHHGFTLIVDGTAAVAGSEDPAGREAEETIAVTPSSAIWHRPARHTDGPSAPPGAGEDSDTCGNECRPVGG